jgi:hypothetical protein
MSETTPEAAQPTAPEETNPEAATAPEEATPQDVDYRAEAEKWKALSRQNEAQAKANAEKAKRFDEVEEAQKSELQKAEERAAAAIARAEEVEQRALRAEVAAETGVPLNLLHGSTAEELQASAAAALAWRAPKASAVGGADLTGGSAPARTYTRAQIADPAFYKANRSDILAAQQQGRIIS